MATERLSIKHLYSVIATVSTTSPINEGSVNFQSSNGSPRQILESAGIYLNSAKQVQLSFAISKTEKLPAILMHTTENILHDFHLLFINLSGCKDGICYCSPTA